MLVDGSHTLATFIDSGADDSIIHENLALQLGINQVHLPCPDPGVPLAPPPQPTHRLGKGIHPGVELILSPDLPEASRCTPAACLSQLCSRCIGVPTEYHDYQARPGQCLPLGLDL